MAQETDRAPVLEVLAWNLYLRRVRRIPKMSQPRLAELSGVSLNMIAGLEGARDPAKTAPFPQLDTLEKLAAGLDCTVADLLDETNYRNSSTARESSFADWPSADEPKVLASAGAGG